MKKVIYANKRVGVVIKVKADIGEIEVGIVETLEDLEKVVSGEKIKFEKTLWLTSMQRQGKGSLFYREGKEYDFSQGTLVIIFEDSQERTKFRKITKEGAKKYLK